MNGHAYAFFPFSVVRGSLATSITFGVSRRKLSASFSFVICQGLPLTPLSVVVQWELAMTPLRFMVVLIVIVDDLRRCPDFLAESFNKLLILPSHLLEVGCILLSHLLDASHEGLHLSFCYGWGRIFTLSFHYSSSLGTDPFCLLESTKMS